MRSPQLYTVIKDIELPDYSSPSLRSRSPRTINASGFPFMRWPDGKPCVAVNSYILDLQQTGLAKGTLKEYASKISHLVRYCSVSGTGFDKLTDNDIWNLSELLQAERRRCDPSALERGANRVREIISSAINFLVWYQSRYVVHGSEVLVGEASEVPRIKVQIKANEHYFFSSKRNKKRKITLAEYDASGSHYLVHRSMPTVVSSERKRPITQEQIQAIERAIDNKSLSEYVGMSDALHEVTREYLRARRMLTVFLMKRTGLRPQELINIKLDQDVVKKRSLAIPTMKTRKSEPPVRHFPLKMRDGLRFLRYTAIRSKFVNAITRESDSYIDPGVLLLSYRGDAISKDSISKDFARLAHMAGFTDTNLCFRQFRIRFITQQVAMHLKEKMQQTGREQRTFEEADYTTILKRIAELTGHTSEKSLWFYVDLGWEQLGLWSDVDRNIERLQAADAFFDELMELKHDIEYMGNKSPEQVIDFCIQGIGRIIGDTKAILEEGDEMQSN